MNGQHLLKHSLYRAALHVDMNTVFVKESGLRIRVKFIFKKSIICLFGVFFVTLENFSLIWRHQHCRRRAANIDLCLELMAIEQ